MPSFTLSELTRAFQIGFILYLVFVVVDLIVATVLLALGMSMILAHHHLAAVQAAAVRDAGRLDPPDPRAGHVLPLIHPLKEIAR